MNLKDFLEQIKANLEADNIPALDELLARFYSTNFEEQDISEIEAILTEVTLYSELKENTYKEKALELLQEV